MYNGWVQGVGRVGRSVTLRLHNNIIYIAVCSIVDRNNHKGTIARAEVDIVGSLVPYTALLII